LLEKDKRFALLMENTKKNEANLQSPAAMENYKKNVAAWQKRADEAKAAKKPFIERAPGAPDGWLHGNARPGNIYNGVLLPTIGYGIKGAIWYQGESNAGRAYEYASLFPFMISDWRQEWGQGDFPFYWVQLADFMNEEADAEKATASQWAELRESQTKTQTAIKNGGQAVIIDIGEGKDIHPKDYGQKLVWRSPEYKSMTVAGDKATITLDTFGSSLQTFDVKEGRGFVICGEDHKWVWADAQLKSGNTIEVSSKTVAKPVAVRYAWSNNPVCNVFNKEWLPVTPFRTDDFEMLTKPK
jgi:sialate O-acetylesterase